MNHDQRSLLNQELLNYKKLKNGMTLEHVISKNVECHITACILSKVHNTTLLKFLKSSKRTKPIHELNTYKNP